MGGRPLFRGEGGKISSCRVGSRRGIQLPVSEDEGGEGMEGKERVGCDHGSPVGSGLQGQGND